MKIGRGNRSTRRKPTPASLCPPQNSTWQTRSRSPDRSGGKSAINRLSYGAAFFLVPFRRLLRLAGSRWRYPTPPPHGHTIQWKQMVVMWYTTIITNVLTLNRQPFCYRTWMVFINVGFYWTFIKHNHNLCYIIALKCLEKKLSTCNRCEVVFSDTIVICHYRSDSGMAAWNKTIWGWKPCNKTHQRFLICCVCHIN
jgi:hypothetical protein